MFFERIRNWFKFNLLYLGNPPWDTGVTPPELEDFIEANQPGNALDLGCGTGTNLVQLAKAGWKVTGIDFVAKAAKEARKKLRAMGLAGVVIQGDVAEIRSLEPPYHLILDIGCFHGLPAATRRIYQDNIGRLLDPLGTFLLYAHLKNDDVITIHGVSEDEIEKLGEKFQLIRRIDSVDRFGRKTSWLSFKGRVDG